VLTITRRYTFSSAHHLIGMRERHKCSNLHGHNYVLEVTVSGTLHNGLIVDAADLDIAVGPVLARIDHHDLNEVAKAGGPAAVLVQPSVENVAAYLWAALAFLRRDSTGGFRLERLRLYETERLWAEVTST